jgi:hypothetical protein
MAIAMEMQHYNLAIFVSAAFSLAFVCGISYNQKYGQRRCCLSMFWAGLYSGNAGVVIYCLGHHFAGPDAFAINLCLCGASALGGDKLLHAINQASKKLINKWLGENGNG